MRSLFHKTIEQLEEEKLLIAQAQSNSKDFEPLYNQNFEKIFRFVYQRVETKDEASDITSQVFLKALLNLKKFKYKSIPFSAWLFRIAISEISNYYSKSGKNRTVNVETNQLNNFFDSSEPSLDEERIEQILNTLKKISGEDLLLIEMRFFENRPFKEIGNILKVTENNAKVRVYRIIDKLKHSLNLKS